MLWLVCRPTEPRISQPASQMFLFTARECFIVEAKHWRPDLEQIWICLCQHGVKLALDIAYEQLQKTYHVKPCKSAQLVCERANSSLWTIQGQQQHRFLPTTFRQWHQPAIMMAPAAASSSASKQRQQQSRQDKPQELTGERKDTTEGIYSTLLLAILAGSGMLARAINSLTILLHAKFSTPKLRSSIGSLALSAMTSAESLPAGQK